MLKRLIRLGRTTGLILDSGLAAFGVSPAAAARSLWSDRKVDRGRIAT